MAVFTAPVVGVKLVMVVVVATGVGVGVGVAVVEFPPPHPSKVREASNDINRVRLSSGMTVSC
jgi:hypothetical protein